MDSFLSEYRLIPARFFTVVLGFIFTLSAEADNLKIQTNVSSELMKRVLKRSF